MYQTGKKNLLLLHSQLTRQKFISEVALPNLNSKHKHVEYYPCFLVYITFFFIYI